jgi:sugar (pentulose or hexulose) kinase
MENTLGSWLYDAGHELSLHRAFACLAGIGIGLYKNLDQAYERVKKTKKQYNPNLELTAKYTTLFEIFKSIYPSLKSINNSLFDRFKV